MTSQEKSETYMTMTMRCGELVILKGVMWFLKGAHRRDHLRRRQMEDMDGFVWPACLW